MSSAPSFTQHEPFSPPAMATPVLFGGHRGPTHMREQSRGDADMWDGSDEHDAGAELFSNLSVTCCMSPTGNSLETPSPGAQLCRIVLHAIACLCLKHADYALEEAFFPVGQPI